MFVIRAHLLAAGILTLSPAAGAEQPQALTLGRIANRLVLSDSRIVEVVVQRTISVTEGGSSATSYVRTAGDVFTVSSKEEGRLSEFSVACEKTRISVRTDFSFARANLPIPVSVLIGDKVHRLLASATEKPVAPEAQRRVHEAISKLPTRFRTGLRTILSLVQSPDDSGLVPSLGTLMELFAEPVEAVGIIDSTPLSPPEMNQLLIRAQPHSGGNQSGETRDSLAAVEAVAARFVLSDKRIVEVIGRPRDASDLRTDTAYVRVDRDTVFVISSRKNSWGVREVTVSARNSSVKLRFDPGYSDERLPTPLTIDIGSDFYPLFISYVGADQFEPKARDAAQGALKKLPPVFLAGLHLIAELAANPDTGVSAKLAVLKELFVDPTPAVAIESSTPLKAGEVDEIRTARP